MFFRNLKLQKLIILPHCEAKSWGNRTAKSLFQEPDRSKQHCEDENSASFWLAPIRKWLAAGEPNWLSRRQNWNSTFYSSNFLPTWNRFLVLFLQKRLVKINVLLFCFAIVICLQLCIYSYVFPLFPIIAL
jgi:hypothetical protein